MAEETTVTETALTKEQAQEIAKATQQAQGTAPEQQQAPGLAITDIAAVVRIIDACSERGAFRGDELQAVGTIRGRFAEFVEYAKATGQLQEAPAEEAPAEEA